MYSGNGCVTIKNTRQRSKKLDENFVAVLSLVMTAQSRWCEDTQY